MESVQRNARLQLSDAPDRPAEPQEADVHRPAGSWRDHVQPPHLQGDECLPQHFGNPLHTSLIGPDGLMNGPAMVNAMTLRPPVRNAINAQATRMQGRNNAQEALHQVQVELTLAEAELTTAQQALVAARNMEGGEPQVELARVTNAGEQLQRKLDQRGVIERDLELNQRLVDEGHANLEARLQEPGPPVAAPPPPPPPPAWYDNRDNRVLVYAVMLGLTAAYGAAVVGRGEESINREFSDTAGPIDNAVAALQRQLAGFAAQGRLSDEPRAVQANNLDRQARIHAHANRMRAEALQADQWAPVPLVAGMLILIAVIELVCVYGRRFVQQ